jgi:hypothetical protein
MSAPIQTSPLLPRTTIFRCLAATPDSGDQTGSLRALLYVTCAIGCCQLRGAPMSPFREFPHMKGFSRWVKRLL